MRNLIFAIAIVFATVANAEEAAETHGMTQDHLHDLIHEVGSDVTISGNLVHFRFDGAELLCVSDANADRMRIISPIAELAEMDSEQLLLALAANFHSTLDVRYAISEGIVYSAFLHPLTPLSDEQAVSAIAQVARARNTFGNEYSSGEMFFGGRAAP